MPAYLNQEVLSRDEFRYQPKSNGYQLYSVGWNQKDDGGEPKNYLPPNNKDDWLWPNPNP